MKKSMLFPQALLLVTAVAICYHGVLGYPFHWDDTLKIESNPAIRDISNIRAVWEYNPARFLVFLSFAVNYYFGGLDTYGYHLFNVAIHMANSIIVLIFGSMLVAAWRGGGARWPWSWLPFFSAIIFAVHPLQTGAVTYIWQRNTSMVAMFYMSAMTLYLSAAVAGKEASRLLKNPAIVIERSESDEAISQTNNQMVRDRHSSQRLLRDDISRVFQQPSRRPARLRYAGAVICAICAMFTKQTAVTLPIALVMLEFFFVNPADDRERIKRLAPFFGTMFIIPVLALTGMDRELGDIAMRGQNVLSHAEYFLTQLNVIVTYLRLLVFPVNQNLDYDYPIAHSFPDSIASACILSGLVALAVAFYRRERIISFGILFFFLALSVESSVFPLEDVIFEHRAYLPSAGAIIAFWVGLFYMLEKFSPIWLKKKSVVIAITLALIALTSAYAAATINRNEMWRDRETLWADVVKKSPGKPRSYNNLGALYLAKSNLDEAEKLFRQASAIGPKYPLSLYNMAVISLKRDDLDAALKYLEEAAAVDVEMRYPLFSLGEGYLNHGKISEALKCYRLAVKLKPGIPQGWRGLVQALEAAGDKEEAANVAREILRRWPEAQGDEFVRDIASRPESKKP